MTTYLSYRISIRPGGIKRVFSLSLTGAFLFTNVLTPYAAEKNFWSERQKTVQKMKQESELLGTLTSAGMQVPKQPVSHLNKEQYQLLAQLPHVAKFDLSAPTSSLSLSRTSSLTPTPLPSGEGGQRPGEGDQHNKRNELNELRYSDSWLSAILPYGSIGDIYISKRSDSPLVIHIQDVHGVLEAQKNISNIITAIVDAQRNRSPKTDDRKPKTDGEFRTSDFGPRTSVVIGLEGAAGAFNIHPYRNFPDAEVTKDIAEYFLKEGYIGGPEFAALTAPETPFLWGVEDLSLYEKNIQTIYDSQKSKPQLQAILNELKKSATSLKEKIYSKELKEFDQHFNAYKNEQEKLGEYVRYLFSTLTSISTYPHPNLNLLLQALQLEETLDFKVVEQERIQLIETLVKKLTQEQLTELVQESINYKLGHLNYGEYHQYLKQLCKNNSIPIRNFAKLNSYINYVGVAERINRNKLLDELTNLEEQVQNSLAVTQEQKRLVAANKSLIMLQKLANHEMTTDDWTYYEKNKEEIISSLNSLSLRERGRGEGISAAGLNEPNKLAPSLKSLTPVVKPFEDFCRYATQRNNALVSNLLTSTLTSTYVLIAGGFHTSGLTQILRQKDVSYVVVTPKITEVPKDNHYLDVFARKPLPLEKLFTGEKIFIVSPLLTAEKAPYGLSLIDFKRKMNELKGKFSSIQILTLLDKTAQNHGSEEELQKAIDTIGKSISQFGLQLKELTPNDIETITGATLVDSAQITGENYSLQFSGAVTGDNKIERDAIAKHNENRNNKYIGAIRVGNKWLLFYGVRHKRFVHLRETLVKQLSQPALKLVPAAIQRLFKGDRQEELDRYITEEAPERATWKFGVWYLMTVFITSALITTFTMNSSYIVSLDDPAFFANIMKLAAPMFFFETLLYAVAHGKINGLKYYLNVYKFKDNQWEPVSLSLNKLKSWKALLNLWGRISQIHLPLLIVYLATPLTGLFVDNTDIANIILGIGTWHLGKSAIRVTTQMHKSYNVAARTSGEVPLAIRKSNGFTMIVTVIGLADELFSAMSDAVAKQYFRPNKSDSETDIVGQSQDNKDSRALRGTEHTLINQQITAGMNDVNAHAMLRGQDFNHDAGRLLDSETLQRYISYLNDADFIKRLSESGINLNDIKRIAVLNTISWDGHYGTTGREAAPENSIYLAEDIMQAVDWLIQLGHIEIDSAKMGEELPEIQEILLHTPGARIYEKQLILYHADDLGKRILQYVLSHEYIELNAKMKGKSDDEINIIHNKIVQANKGIHLIIEQFSNSNALTAKQHDIYYTKQLIIFISGRIKETINKLPPLWRNIDTFFLPPLNKILTLAEQTTSLNELKSLKDKMLNLELKVAQDLLDYIKTAGDVRTLLRDIRNRIETEPALLDTPTEKIIPTKERLTAKLNEIDRLAETAISREDMEGLKREIRTLTTSIDQYAALDRLSMSIIISVYKIAFGQETSKSYSTLNQQVWDFAEGYPPENLTLLMNLLLELPPQLINTAIYALRANYGLREHADALKEMFVGLKEIDNTRFGDHVPAIASFIAYLDELISGNKAATLIESLRSLNEEPEGSGVIPGLQKAMQQNNLIKKWLPNFHKRIENDQYYRQKVAPWLETGLLALPLYLGVIALSAFGIHPDMGSLLAVNAVEWLVVFPLLHIVQQRAPPEDIFAATTKIAPLTFIIISIPLVLKPFLGPAPFLITMGVSFWLAEKWHRRINIQKPQGSGHITGHDAVINLSIRFLQYLINAPGKPTRFKHAFVILAIFLTFGSVVPLIVRAQPTSVSQSQGINLTEINQTYEQGLKKGTETKKVLLIRKMQSAIAQMIHELKKGNTVDISIEPDFWAAKLGLKNHNDAVQAAKLFQEAWNEVIGEHFGETVSSSQMLNWVSQKLEEEINEPDPNLVVPEAEQGEKTSKPQGSPTSQVKPVSPVEITPGKEIGLIDPGNIKTPQGSVPEGNDIDMWAKSVIAQQLSGNMRDPELLNLFQDILKQIENNNVVLVSSESGETRTWSDTSMRRLLLFVREILKIFHEVPEGILDQSSRKIPFTIEALEEGVYGQVDDGLTIKISMEQHLGNGQRKESSIKIERWAASETNMRELRKTIYHETLGHSLAFTPSKKTPGDYVLPLEDWQRIAQILQGKKAAKKLTHEFVEKNVKSVEQTGRVNNRLFLKISEAIAASLEGDVNSLYVIDLSGVNRISDIRKILSDHMLVGKDGKHYEFNKDGNDKWTEVEKGWTQSLIKAIRSITDLIHDTLNWVRNAISWIGNQFVPKANKTFNQRKQAKDMLRQHLEFMLNNPDVRGIPNTDDTYVWRQLLAELKENSSDTNYPAEVAEKLLNNESLLHEFTALYIKSFEEAKKDTGSPFINDRRNLRQMLELLKQEEKQLYRGAQDRPHTRYMDTPGAIGAWAGLANWLVGRRWSPRGIGWLIGVVEGLAIGLSGIAAVFLTMWLMPQAPAEIVSAVLLFGFRGGLGLAHYYPGILQHNSESGRYESGAKWDSNAAGRAADIASWGLIAIPFVALGLAFTGWISPILIGAGLAAMVATTLFHGKQDAATFHRQAATPIFTGENVSHDIGQLLKAPKQLLRLLLLLWRMSFHSSSDPLVTTESPAKNDITMPPTTAQRPASGSLRNVSPTKPAIPIKYIPRNVWASHFLRALFRNFLVPINLSIRFPQYLVNAHALHTYATFYIVGQEATKLHENSVHFGTNLAITRDGTNTSEVLASEAEAAKAAETIERYFAGETENVEVEVLEGLPVNLRIPKAHLQELSDAGWDQASIQSLLRIGLEQHLARGDGIITRQDLENLARDSDHIFFAIVDVSSHLWEDHALNRRIFINRALLELKQEATKNNDKVMSVIADAHFASGGTHEFIHEATGKATREFEEKLSVVDREIIASLLISANVNLDVYEKVFFDVLDDVSLSGILRETVLQMLPDAVERFLLTSPAGQPRDENRLVLETLNEVKGINLSEKSEEELLEIVAGILSIVQQKTSTSKKQKQLISNEELIKKLGITPKDGKAAHDIIKSVELALGGQVVAEPLDVIGLFDPHSYRRGFDRIQPALERIVHVARTQGRPVVLIVEDDRNPLKSAVEGLSHPDKPTADKVRKFIMSGNKVFLKGLDEYEEKMQRNLKEQRDIMGGQPTNNILKYRQGLQDFINRYPEIMIFREQRSDAGWLAAAKAGVYNFDLVKASEQGNEAAYIEAVESSLQHLKESWKLRDKAVRDDQLPYIKGHWPKAIVVIVRGPAHDRMLDGLNPQQYRQFVGTTHGMHPDDTEPVAWVAYRMLIYPNRPLSNAEKQYFKSEWTYAHEYGRNEKDPAVQDFATNMARLRPKVVEAIGQETLAHLRRETPPIFPGIRMDGSGADAPLTTRIVNRVFFFLPKRVRELVAALIVESFPTAIIALSRPFHVKFSNYLLEQFLNAHEPVPDKLQQQRRKGMGWIIKATQIGFVAGLWLGLVTALLALTPGIILPNFAGNLNDIYSVIIFTLKVTGVSTFISNAGAHFYYNLRHKEAPLTIPSDQSEPQLEKLRHFKPRQWENLALVPIQFINAIREASVLMKQDIFDIYAIFLLEIRKVTLDEETNSRKKIITEKFILAALRAILYTFNESWTASSENITYMKKKTISLGNEFYKDMLNKNAEEIINQIKIEDLKNIALIFAMNNNVWWKNYMDFLINFIKAYRKKYLGQFVNNDTLLDTVTYSDIIIHMGHMDISFLELIASDDVTLADLDTIDSGKPQDIFRYASPPLRKIYRKYWWMYRNDTLTLKKTYETGRKFLKKVTFGLINEVTLEIYPVLNFVADKFIEIVFAPAWEMPNTMNPEKFLNDHGKYTWLQKAGAYLIFYATLSVIALGIIVTADGLYQLSQLPGHYGESQQLFIRAGEGLLGTLLGAILTNYFAHSHYNFAAAIFGWEPLTIARDTEKVERLKNKLMAIIQAINSTVAQLPRETVSKEKYQERVEGVTRQISEASSFDELQLLERNILEPLQIEINLEFKWHEGEYREIWEGIRRLYEQQSHKIRTLPLILDTPTRKLLTEFNKFAESIRETTTLEDLGELESTMQTLNEQIRQAERWNNQVESIIRQVWQFRTTNYHRDLSERILKFAYTYPANDLTWLVKLLLELPPELLEPVFSALKANRSFKDNPESFKRLRRILVKIRDDEHFAEINYRTNELITYVDDLNPPSGMPPSFKGLAVIGLASLLSLASMSGLAMANETGSPETVAELLLINPIIAFTMAALMWALLTNPYRILGWLNSHIKHWLLGKFHKKTQQTQFDDGGSSAAIKEKLRKFFEIDRQRKLSKFQKDSDSLSENPLERRWSYTPELSGANRRIVPPIQYELQNEPLIIDLNENPAAIVSVNHHKLVFELKNGVLYFGAEGWPLHKMKGPNAYRYKIDNLNLAITLDRQKRVIITNLSGKTAQRLGFVLDWVFDLLSLSKEHWFYKVSAIGLGPLVETIILHAWVFGPTGLSAGSFLLASMIFSLVHFDAWIDLLLRKAGDKKKISFGQFLDIVTTRAMGGMAFIALLYVPGAIHIPFLGTLSLPSFGVHAFLLNLPIVLWINKQISEGKIPSKVIRPFFAAEPSSSSLDDLKTVIERVFSKEGKYNQKLQNLLDLMADKVLENQDFTDSFSTARGRYELSVTAIAIHNASVPQGLLRIRITTPLYQQQPLSEEEIEIINRYLFLLTVEFNTGEKTTDIITFTRLEPAEWIPAQIGYKSMEAFLAFDASGQVMNADLHGIRQNYPASNQQIVPLTIKLRINREEALSQIRILRQYLGQADQEFRAGNLDEADRLVRIVLQGSPENNITGLNEFLHFSPARWYPPAAHSIFYINTAVTELAKEIKTLKMWAELLSKLPETTMSEAGEIANNLQTMFSQFTSRHKRIAINLVSLILLPVLRNLRIKLITQNNRIDQNDISIYEHTMFGFMSILPNSPQDPFYTETAALLGTAEQITEEIKRQSMEIMKKKTRLSPGEREKALNLAREHVDQNKGQELIELFSYSELADYVLFEWVEKDITRYEQAIDLLIDGYIKPNTIRVDKIFFYHFEGRLQTAIDTIQQRIGYWRVVPELIDNDFLNKAAALIESLRSLDEDISGQQPEFMPEGSGVIPWLQKAMQKSTLIDKRLPNFHGSIRNDQYYRQKVAPRLETGLFTLPLYIGVIALAAFGIYPDTSLLLKINAIEWLVVFPLSHIFPQRAPSKDIFAATVKIAPLSFIITSIPLLLQPFLGLALSLITMSASYWLTGKWHAQINTPLSQEAKMAILLVGEAGEPENISKFAPQLFDGDEDSDDATVDAAQAESEVKNPLLGLRDLEVRNVIQEILLFYNQKYEHPVPKELASTILDTIAKHSDDPAAALNAVYTEVTDPRQTGSPIYLAYNNLSYRLHTKLQLQLELIRHLLPDSGVIVNVGAGDNALANYIIREKPELIEYIGTDVLDYSVEPTDPERIKYFPQDKPDKLPEEIKDGSADAVIMIAVLHHTGQFAPALLQEVRRILKPGGRFIVLEDTWSDQIPPKFVTNPLDKFLALQPSQRYAILEFIDWYANHFIKGIFEMPLPLGFKTLEDWSTFLTEQGFQVEQTEFFGIPDLPFSPRPPQGVLVLKKPEDKIEKLLNKLADKKGNIMVFHEPIKDQPATVLSGESMHIDAVRKGLSTKEIKIKEIRGEQRPVKQKTSLREYLAKKEKKQSGGAPSRYGWAEHDPILRALNLLRNIHRDVIVDVINGLEESGVLKHENVSEIMANIDNGGWVDALTGMPILLSLEIHKRVFNAVLGSQGARLFENEVIVPGSQTKFKNSIETAVKQANEKFGVPAEDIDIQIIRSPPEKHNKSFFKSMLQLILNRTDVIAELTKLDTHQLMFWTTDGKIVIHEHALQSWLDLEEKGKNSLVNELIETIAHEYYEHKQFEHHNNGLNFDDLAFLLLPSSIDELFAENSKKRVFISAETINLWHREAKWLENIIHKMMLLGPASVLIKAVSQNGREVNAAIESILLEDETIKVFYTDPKTNKKSTAYITIPPAFRLNYQSQQNMERQPSERKNESEQLLRAGWPTKTVLAIKRALSTLHRRRLFKILGSVLFMIYIVWLPGWAQAKPIGITQYNSESNLNAPQNIKIYSTQFSNLVSDNIEIINNSGNGQTSMEIKSAIENLYRENKHKIENANNLAKLISQRLFPNNAILYDEQNIINKIWIFAASNIETINKTKEIANDDKETTEKIQNERFREDKKALLNFWDELIGPLLLLGDYDSLNEEHQYILEELTKSIKIESIREVGNITLAEYDSNTNAWQATLREKQPLVFTTMAELIDSLEHKLEILNFWDDVSPHFGEGQYEATEVQLSILNLLESQIRLGERTFGHILIHNPNTGQLEMTNVVNELPYDNVHELLSNFTQPNIFKPEENKQNSEGPSRYGLVDFNPVFRLLDVTNRTHKEVAGKVITALKNSGALDKDIVIDTSKDHWVNKLSGVPILLPLELHKEVFSAVFNAAGNIFLPAGKNTEFEEAISKAISEAKTFGVEIASDKIHIIRGPPESELPENVLAALKEAHTDKFILWTTDGHILIHEDTIRNWQKEKLDLVTEFTKTIIHENHEYQRYQEALKDLKPGESITKNQVDLWHEEAGQREMLVMPVIAEIKTVTEDQEDNIKAWYRALLEQLLLDGEARPVDFEPVLRFDVVKHNVEIGKRSPVDQSKVKYWDGFVANWINVLEKRNPSFLSVGQNGNKDILNNIYTSPLKFARALIRARKDSNFRQLVALDILEKVKEAKDDKRFYENILSEVALLRASGSSLFSELDGKGGTQTRDYLERDIDFLIQLYFMLGLAENKSAKETHEHLDMLFNMFNDQILRRAVMFDVVEQLFSREGNKNDGNLMVFDVSELLSDEDIDIKKEPRKLMADSLIYLAAKLQEAPESIAGSVTLISNYKNMDDRDILNNLVKMSGNYRGLDDAANILEDNLGRKVIFKTADMNKKLLNHDNKISLNTLRTLLANRYRVTVTTMEVYGLNTKETLDDKGLDISLKIIDLVTNATAEFQRKLKETRFVEIQA